MALWMLLLGGLSSVLAAPAAVVEQAFFTADGARLVTANRRTTQVWDVARGRSLKKLSVRVDRGASDRLLHGHMVWSARTGRRISTLAVQNEERPGDTSYARFSADGRRVVSASSRRVSVWNAASGEREQAFEHEASVIYAALTPDGTQVVVTDRQGRVAAFSVATGQRLLLGPPGPPGDPRKPLRIAGLSPDGTKVLGIREGTVAVFDLAGETWAWEVTGLPDHIVGTWAGGAFTPDGSRIVVFGGSYLAVRDVVTGELQLVLRQFGSTRQLVFSEDGRYMLTYGRESQAYLWDAEGFALRHVLRHARRNKIRAAAISADGTRVATAGEGGTIVLWDTDEGTATHELVHP